jgi:hypothetical protein
MNILKIALLCSLRVAFFASLKVALLAYTLFLSDTAFASAVPEGNGNAGDTALLCRTRGESSRRQSVLFLSGREPTRR